MASCKVNKNTIVGLTVEDVNDIMGAIIEGKTMGEKTYSVSFTEHVKNTTIAVLAYQEPLYGQIEIKIGIARRRKNEKRNLIKGRILATIRCGIPVI